VVKIDLIFYEKKNNFFLGGDLFTYLRHTGKFIEKHVKFYAAQIFLVFEYLHHFDIL
jgi:serine/threonine protein kinase